jgi:hypothetical protein
MELQLFNAQAAYAQALRAVVRQATHHNPIAPPLALAYYLEQAQGAYPVDVVATLTDLGLRYQENEAAFHLPPTALAPLRCPDTGALFADPHPADYDWRFNAATVAWLTQIALDSAQGEQLALLGTKTVFAPLVDHGARVTLFNKSRAILDDLRAAGYCHGLIECDLSQPLLAGHGCYQVVVADPPWYLDYYRAFLRRAAELLVQGGTAYVSVLPELTRPGATQDRAAIGQLAAAMGLHLVSQQPGQLVYQTPGFEQQALQARGLHCRDWRRGDLWTFCKVATPTAYPPDEPIQDELTWVEYRVGTTRIKAKSASVERAVRFTYRAADPSGAVSTHVSRRSPFRTAINVWSSANQAYVVTRIALLHAGLALLTAGQCGPEVPDLLSSEYQLDEAEKLNLLALLAELTP